MAADLQLYANIRIELANTVLAEATSISIDKKSGMIPVFTVGSGFSGMTQGASTCEISVENAVPSADFEFSPDQYMRLGTVVDIVIEMAAKQTVVKGFITDCTYSYSINDSSKLSLKLMSRFGDFESLGIV